MTEAALSHLGIEELLHELLDRMVDILDADTAAILLLEEDGATLAARAARGLEEGVERGFRLPVGVGFAGRVAAEREPVVIAQVTPEEVANPLLIEKGISSLLGVPLIAEGELVGVLHVGTLQPRDFTTDDADLLRVAADRAALAIAYARLYDSERRARSRLESLQLVTDAALAYLTLDDLLIALLDRISSVLSADTAAILLLDDEAEGDGPGNLVARAAKGLEEEVEERFTLAVGKGFAGRVAESRAPVVIDDVGPDDVENPLLLEKGVKSLLGVPLVVERGLVGVLHVGSLTLRTFGNDDIELLQLVADRVALAIDHDRLLEQHRLTAAMQRSFLPERVPSIPGVQVAARYLPAEVSTEVGGDWYDVLSLSDGNVGIAIGDVVGHGTAAATLMAQLRNALRAYALEGGAPADTVEKLSAFMLSLDMGGMVTCLYGVLDVDEGVFRYASAGHPPPLVVGEQSSEFGESTRCPPLGMAPAIADEQIVEAPAGSTVLLYTDGLIERRGERLSEGRKRLQVMAARVEPEHLADRLVDELVGPAMATDDDVALVTGRIEPFEATFAHTIPAHAEQLVQVRRFLERWLSHWGAADRVIQSFNLAVGEACANAVEHAYGPAAATFEIQGTVEKSRASIRVLDHGSWRPARGENRGRGLKLMRAFMDDVDVSPSEEGTTITLTHELFAA